jgi:hypothetical protein
MFVNAPVASVETWQCIFEACPSGSSPSTCFNQALAICQKLEYCGVLMID